MCPQGACFDLKLVLSKRCILNHFSLIFPLCLANTKVFEWLSKAINYLVWFAFVVCTLHVTGLKKNARPTSSLTNQSEEVLGQSDSKPQPTVVPWLSSLAFCRACI